MSATLAQRGLLNLKAAAEALSISRATICRLIKDGKLAAFRHGGRVWVAEAEIDDYFARLRADGAKLARARRLASKGKRVTKGDGQ